MANGGDDNTGGPPGGNPPGPNPNDNTNITDPAAMTDAARLEAAQALLDVRKKTLAEQAAIVEEEREALKLEVESLKHSNESMRLAHQRNELRLKDIEFKEVSLAMERKLAREHAASGDAALIQEAARMRASFAAKEAAIERNKEATRSILRTETETKNLIKTLTGVGDQWKQTFAGGFITAALDGTESLTDKMNMFKESLKETLSPANMLGSLLMKVAQTSLKLALEQDAAYAAFNKTTSSMGEYNEMIRSVERENVGLGITTQDSAKAFGSLLTGVTDFAHASAPVPKDLANTAAQMEKLGVSTDLTAKTMENAMRVMGMSAEESQALTGELASMAIQMKLPIEQVTEGFNAAMPVLAKFGTDAPDIFKKVQVASRSLGVAVGDLLNVMGQFDTFGGAAEAAGKLNAILGGDLLNSTELLLATEDERLRMVRESLNMSGRTFDSMNRFEKQAITSALGIQDVATATKMLTGDMDKFGSALDANPLTKEETEERIRKTQAITEKMAQTWRMFAITLEPVVRGLHRIMDGFFKLNEKMHGWLGVGLLAITALSALASGAAKAQKAFISFNATVKALNLSLATGARILIPFVATMGLLHAFDAAPIVKMTVAVLSLAAAFALAWVAASGPGSPIMARLIAKSAATVLAAIGAGAVASLAMGSESDAGTAGGGSGGFDTTEQHMAAGGPAKGGLTLVGEEGPELIVLPAMANVINNDNFTEVFQRYDGAGIGLPGAGIASLLAKAFDPDLQPGEAEDPEPIAQPPVTNTFNSPIFIDVIAETQQVKQPVQKPVEQLTPPPPPPQKSGDTTVVIKIGNQEMGRAVIKAIESVPGYNLRGLPRGA